MLIQSALGQTPSEVLTTFKKSAKSKDFDETWKHVAQFEKLPTQITDYLKQKVQRHISYFSNDSDFQIIEERIDGDCAVVVINENNKRGVASFDIDPVYLIKQNGEWRVFPEISDWKIERNVLGEDVEATYQKLKIWYNEREEALKKQHKN